MNPKLKKALKRAAVVGTGIFAFIGTVIGGYLVTPNRTKYIDVSFDEPEQSAFSQFVERITKDVGLEEDEVEAKNYLSARFEDFNVSYQVDGSMKENTLGVTGGIDLRLSALALDGVEFNIDAVADYNGKKLPITLGSFKNDIYFGLKDMKIKFTQFSEEKLLKEYWYTFARYANLNFPQLFYRLGEIAEEKLGGIIDGLMNPSSQDSGKKATTAEEQGGFDFASLLNGGIKEEFVNGQWEFTIGGGENDDFCIKIYSDEDFVLKQVDLGTISAGPVTISGKVNIDIKPYEEFVSPASDSKFIEVFNYAGLTQKLVSLLKEDSDHQKIGLGFELNLDQVKKVENPVNIANVRGSVNVDLDELLDLSQYQVTDSLIPEKTTSSQEQQQPDPKNAQFHETHAYETIKKVGFNFQLHLIGQNDKEYANLDLAFAEGQGYLRFNEQEDANHNTKSVMKLNVDTGTMNWLVDKIPSLMDNSAGEAEETNTVSTLSKFLSQEVVDAINDGDYSFVLDMLKTLKNDENGFELGIDLKKLGLGNEAELSVKVINDAEVVHVDEIVQSKLSEEEQQAIVEASDEHNNQSKLDIRARNLAFGSFEMDAGIYSTTYSDVNLGLKDEYQSVSFAKDIADQISGLLDSKKTGFEITGQMKDSQGLGIGFTGAGQLNNTEGVKEGYGHMTINQYKYRANEVWYEHNIAVNVTNLAENIHEYEDENGEIKKQNLNKALFVYGDPDGQCVKGQMEIQTFSNIMDIVTTFVDDFADKPKFTKFLKPISEKLGMGALGSIIESKDYVHLASNELLSEVKVINNGQAIQVTVSKTLLSLPTDITIVIGLGGEYGSGHQTLSYLTIDGLRLSDKTDAKVLNMTFRLKDYDNNFNDVVHKNDTYMDLNGVKLLVDMGINSTKANFYRLTASGGLKTKLLWINIDFPIKNIDFNVYVDGEHVKVYGTIGELPGFTGVTQDSSYDVSAKFGFQTYADGDNKVGGMFNIHRTAQKDKTGVYSNPNSWLGYSIGNYTEYHEYHYRTDSANFLDHIAEYLLGGLLGMTDRVLDSIVDSSASSSSEEKPAGNFANTFTSEGFSYSTKGSGMSTVNTIKVGLNLNELTGIDALREVTATIKSRRMDYPGLDGGVDVIGSLDAQMRIHMIVDLNINFNASVTECIFNETNALARWNALGKDGLDALSYSINGTTIGETSQYYNAARNPYTYTIQKKR